MAILNTCSVSHPFPHDRIPAPVQGLAGSMREADEYGQYRDSGGELLYPKRMIALAQEET
jgi:hypothetical protein